VTAYAASRLRHGLLLLALVLAGCASPPRASHLALEPETHWQGRLSLKVYSKPVQSLSANFDLQGSPAKGELALTSPLGTTLVRMQWDAGSASLTAAGEQRDYGSLQELARKATGTDLPVASLFAWLQGREDAAPGWQVDLKDLSNGRLQAQHVDEPQADLKIILDR
jgi:outer membrane lipoprotein LolB